MNTPQILLVDDDAALLQALPYMVSLRLHGVKVDTANSAIEALELIRLHDYDAIVSDIKMPGIDGLELLVQIHNLRPFTPTILITGHLEPDLQARAIRNGAYDFVQKPIDRLYFVAALRRAIQTHQLQCQVEEQRRVLCSYDQMLQQMGERHPDELPEMRELSAAELAASRQPSAPFKPPAWLI